MKAREEDFKPFLEEVLCRSSFLPPSTFREKTEARFLGARPYTCFERKRNGVLRIYTAKFSSEALQAVPNSFRELSKRKTNSRTVFLRYKMKFACNFPTSDPIQNLRPPLDSLFSEDQNRYIELPNPSRNEPVMDKNQN